MKPIYQNFVITITSVCIWVLGSELLDYTQSVQRSPLGPVFFLVLFIPIIFGFSVNFPFNLFKKIEKKKFNWQKFIIQGIPALILAIPLAHLLEGLMLAFHLRQLDLGILTKFIYSQTKINLFHTMAGVWFGKVVSESLVMEEE